MFRHEIELILNIILGNNSKLSLSNLTGSKCKSRKNYFLDNLGISSQGCNSYSCLHYDLLMSLGRVLGGHIYAPPQKRYCVAMESL